ncbi:MAG: GH3 auxin-responsive promoter family protein [Alphaproteobacteria bacterium]
MSRLLSGAVRLRARVVLPRFEQDVRDPVAAQRRVLREILSKNAATAFGREHGFRSIADPREYCGRVPVRDYEGLRPWVDRLLAGERGVLTAEEPSMFATTSGTTSHPKVIPVTRAWMRELSAVMCLWLYFCLRDHPDLLSGKVVSVVGPAVEGHTARGAPLGCISGLTQSKVPLFLRRNYVLPESVSRISSYDDRYAIAARLMLGAQVSAVATANPSTLLRLARIASERAERIVAAVHDGRLGVVPPHASTSEDAARQASLYRQIEARLRPDPGRARALETCMKEHGGLRPRDAWPRLALICCWLGGSAGVQSRRIPDDYGDAPIRDIGLRATEATVTVPIRDGTPAGVLALGGNFYEFAPTEEAEPENPRTLLAHELEEGGRYRLLLTTRSGLYRYDINDVVEVRGFHHNAPLLAFLRKGDDMANITGEKLHADQVASAFQAAVAETNLPAVQVQLIPDAEASCYDLLVELDHTRSADLHRFSAAFDRGLARQNIEYRQKRKSGRLHTFRIWRMEPGWSTRRQRNDVERNGKRDSQYKWPILNPTWDEQTRAEVAETPRAGVVGAEAGAWR